jgi:hypothetical protein
MRLIVFHKNYISFKDKKTLLNLDSAKSQNATQNG